MSASRSTVWGSGVCESLNGKIPYIKMPALLYLDCMRYEVACGMLVIALVYCNFHKEGRLGGWGTEGPKGPFPSIHAQYHALEFDLNSSGK